MLILHYILFLYRQKICAGAGRGEVLSEERLNKILSIVETKRSATVQELADQLGASESTIRRALTVLASGGKLTKVFGGAIAKDMLFTPRAAAKKKRRLRGMQPPLSTKTTLFTSTRALRPDLSLILLPRGKRFSLQIAALTRRALRHWAFARSLRAAKSNIRRTPLSEKKRSSLLKNTILRKAFGAQTASAASMGLQRRTQAKR